MKKLILILTLVWGGGAVGLWYWNDTHAKKTVYRTVAIDRGDLLASINATGTIEPVEVVDVGAQVAGMIQSFGEDARNPGHPISFGSPVEEGTILARLDDALFRARVDQARARVARGEAGVEQAQAKLRQTERELERNKNLRQRGPGMVSATEYDTSLANNEAAQAELDVAQSELTVTKANLEEASVNLSYTTIRSPVAGVILDRRVNIGQTVVASLNVPSLFLIAKDLSRLEIWASVNESDIGAIHRGQDVSFTVSAFPQQSFRGKVSQIRLNASMIQGVVTYTVVVDVDNSSHQLLPYLTARLQFEIQTRKDVLLVPNSALRWRPRVLNVLPAARSDYAIALKRRSAAKAGDNGRKTASKPETSAAAVLWVKAGDFVRPVSVKPGLSDGLMTEVEGSDIREHMEIVTGIVPQDEEDASPFLPKIGPDEAKKD
jgi:HlyD family secretion protein